MGDIRASNSLIVSIIEWGGGGVFSTVKQIKGQRVFGLKSLNLDFRGFVSLTGIVGPQTKVVCKNGRLNCQHNIFSKVVTHLFS